MASFQKNLEKFFIYFFASISVVVVILGIQRVKQSDTLGLTPIPEGDTGTQATGAGRAVAGTTATVTGKTFQTPWGNLATTIKVKDGKIVAVEIPTLPDSPPSVYAEPYLIDQVLRSGSADIQGVSGATITSRAFKASLESALAQAAAQGATVATAGTPTTTTGGTLAVAPTQTTGGIAAQTITATEVARHASRSDCWMTISGKVYDLTAYIPYHPGGTSSIVQECGGDGTSTFLGVRKHLNPSVQAELDTYLVKTGARTGTAVATQRPTSAPATTGTTRTGAVGAGVSGTFTGAAYQTPWGNAVASVTFTNGKITGVSMPQVPNSPPSIQAEPYLIQQALAAGSANIQGVSGATYASLAFKSSLESAIAKARAQGTVATPTPSATAGTATQPKPSIPRKYHDDDDWGEDDDDEWDDEWDD